MYWQCPRIGAGKAAGFTLVRIKQQFSGVVLWCLNFFWHLVEYRDKLDAQSCSGTQGCSEETEHEMAAGSIPGSDCRGNGAGIGLEQIKQNNQNSLLLSPVVSVFRPSPSLIWLVSYSPSPGTVLDAFQNDCTQCYKEPCMSDLVALQKSISCY